MLSFLRVRSLAVIEDLELELGPGLNVVTGETGAGKSVLVRALELVLGGRGRVDLVRAGAERAEIEALFEGPAVRERLLAHGFEGEDELVVHRMLLAGGRSRASVNGRTVSVGQLAQLVSGLVDISSQHEHHSLVDPASHLAYLDAYGGLVARREGVGAVVGEAAAALAELRGAQQRLADRVGREDLLRFQLGELDRVKPRAGEEEAIRAEVERLRHGTELARAALGAEHALVGADASICGRLARTLSELERVARLDPRLEALVAQVRSARVELAEAGADLGRYGRTVDADPTRQGELEERLETLIRLGRRYGGSAEAALAFRERAVAELEELEDLDGVLARAEGALKARLAVAGDAARALSAERRETAGRLAEAFASELAGLGMGDAAVRVEVAPLEGADAALSVDGARLLPTGMDRVEFRIAPNPGSAPLPLGQVASGGELSRALLALKCALAGIGPGAGLYVFDEVDTGVGGAIAEVIGRKLAAVGRSHQVLCITHLPQIAAFADRHLRVSKRVEAGSTRTEVDPLSPEQRLDELARMLGGLRVTETTRRAAFEMVTAASLGVEPARLVQ